MIMKMETKFKVCTPKPARCRSVHARGFTAGQKNIVENQDQATGPPGRRGPWASEPLGRKAADLLLSKPVLECCNFLSYRFPSSDGKVLGQISRGQVCWLAL